MAGLVGVIGNDHITALEWVNPSPFALYIVASQVHQLLAQDVEKVAVLILAPPSDESQEAATAI